MVLALLLSAIQLMGVSGNDLRVRAFFDANNVKVGDPLILTVDFLGDAEFADLHPPALSKAVSRRDWKLDDISAKTSTFRDARRLTYRIRPMREGVLWFPAIEFEYDGKVVRSNPIPVHARGGSQVMVAELGAVEENGFPKPPELKREFGGATADEEFRWRKALAHPKADAFAEFAFPAAQFNEATCAIREGNWARALSAYRSLEWRVGQTPEIERGIIAALALRYDNPAVELPVWRSVFRPLLRFAWAGRLVVFIVTLLALALLLKLLSLGIRAMAALAAVLLLACPAAGEVTETVVTNADGSVVHSRTIRDKSGNMSFSFSSSTSSGGAMPSLGGFGQDPFGMMDEAFGSFGFGRPQKRAAPVEIKVALTSDKTEVTVGETFNLLLTIERPRGISFADGVRLSIDEHPCLKQVSRGYALSAAESKNPTNVLERMVFPMTALTPIKGPLHYSVAADYTSGRGFGLFARSYPFASGKRTCAMSVKPPPAEGRPDGYGGVVAEGLSVMELPDLLLVETNDVITITYRVRTGGFVPKDYLPKDAAYEWRRDSDDGAVEYKRYLVANGMKATPAFVIPYYDPSKRRYRIARCGGTAIKYKPTHP